MLRHNCPGWKYRDHPDVALLRQRVANSLRTLRRGRWDTLESAKDTRRIHHDIFRGLTPSQCPYYAGHYRGEAFLCLEAYEVHVRSGNRVVFEGTPAADVAVAMERFQDSVETALNVLDAVCAPES